MRLGSVDRYACLPSDHRAIVLRDWSNRENEKFAPGAMSFEGSWSATNNSSGSQPAAR
jgi:hypothetical protein